ncbi:MAG TPA: PA14 domain-containing protein, partial [Candidatus Saccharimonadales bacterium]|nr:PA14 domain-containing protein [Candidatus Saccharimonadales bacterium]
MKKRRGILNVSKKVRLGTRQAWQRAGMVTMLTVFLVSSSIPTASAIVADRQVKDLLKKNSHIQPFDEASTQEHSYNYPSGMKATTAPQIAARDASVIDKDTATGLPGAQSSRRNAAGETLKGFVQSPKIQARELTDKRTARTSMRVNPDGSITQRNYFESQFYQKDGQWTDIDTTLTEDTNAGDSGNVFGKLLGKVESLFSDPTTYTTTKNSWQARFASSDQQSGMVRLQKDGSQIGYAPVNAKTVAPVITTNGNNQQVVHYYDLWPGVNVEYVVTADAVKENIVLKNKDAATSVAFKVVGATLAKQKDGFGIRGALGDDFAIAAPTLILNTFGPETKNVLNQEYADGTLTVAIDKDYLQSLPDTAFPAVIDPTTFQSNFGTRAGGTYVSLKSDGYVCQSNTCNPYAGSLYDSNYTLRYWRSAVFAPYDQLNNSGNILTNATLHLLQRTNAGFWTGNYNTHNFQVGHATCTNNFGCLEGGTFNASGSFATAGDINVTNIYQAMISRGDFGAWLMLGGEDGTTDSFKNFDPGTGGTSGSYVSFTYGGQPSAPSVTTPTDNQVYVDTQPSFSVGTVSNPNGSTPLQYEILVSGAPGATGALITSGKQDATQWTIPDGILQDGSTYYVQARSYDPITSSYSMWGTSVGFKIDTRTGKDKSQTYDTLGPVSVDLATGNLSTSAASHSSAALGGALGVNLEYNSPLRSRSGLVGQYWNNTSYTGDPVVTRVDQNIDFNWGTGSPSGGTINTDNFAARWEGYFVAPETGSYQFGSDVDDGCKIWINSNVVLDNWTWCGNQYGTSVSLTAGQIVPIRMDYREVGGSATARLKVKGVVSTDGMVVPSDWLQTGVRPVGTQYGLTGSYFARRDGTNTFSTGNAQVMKRVDPYLSFNWGTGAPVPGGPSDFLIRWQGYVTAPTTGTYSFGTRSDDGTKITIGSNNTVVQNDWTEHGAPASPTWGGTTFNMTANVPVPITIEYFDTGGAASFEFWMKSASVPQQIVPTTWMTPSANVLPAGWNMGLDAGGSVAYDHLKTNQNSVTLTDASGATHEYKWSGSGYTPPDGEDGVLIRNDDGSYTLQDVDGRTYVFATDGTLTSVTSSVDDRNPAALQYEYQSQNGGPTHLYKIKDGVDTSRNATLYYSGDSNCGTAPTGFDASAPGGMLCAVKTDDGRATNFFYLSGQLARIQLPGNEATDFRYEAVNNAASQLVGYRLNAVRSSLAMDAIGAGKRADDDTANSQMSYDTLGRVVSVTQPAPTTGATRVQHTIEYLPGAKSYVDANGNTVPGYTGLTKEHVVGGSEPNGYTRRVKYDTLFRTIEDTDITGQSATTEWDAQKDLVYSATDSLGLKSTTVYDDEDRPVSSYGPAPKAWFDTSNPKQQVPLAAYASQVARTDASYDQGVNGLAVSYMAASTKTISNTLAAGQTIPKGTDLYSLDRRFHFAYQNDSNLVLYGPSGVGALWSSNTGGTTTSLAMQTDGNLVLYNGGTAVWSSGTGGQGTSNFVVQNDGNAVIYKATGPTWATNTSSNAGVAYQVNLTGAPLQHATNIATDGTLVKNFGTTAPVSGYSGMWGMRLSGKMRLPATGTYSFRINSDGGARMWIDDKLVIDDWKDSGARNHPTGTFSETIANKPHRVVIDYFRTGKATDSATFGLYMTPPGGSETSQTATYFSPDYSLPTSAKSYDSTLGDKTVNTNYGTNPELGLAQSSSVDPGGLNLTTSTTYEQQGASGSYLRQTSKSLPGNSAGNPSFTYVYYGASETRDNPCTTPVEAFKQAGMLKTSTDASPNGSTAGVKTENVYDDAGRVVATRTNSDGWTCTTYDSRGRVSTSQVPAVNGAAARTVSNDYAVGGDPFQSSTWDGNGWIVKWVDLLGRTTKYRDVYDHETTTIYDNFGKLTQRASPIGTESYDYDTFNRLTAQKLDGTTYASISYDTYSRVSQITYPNAGQMKVVPGYDSLLRANSVTYTMGDGTTTIASSANFTQSGKVSSDTVTAGSTSLQSSYGYDGAGRLTSATVGTHNYSYGFGTQDTTTCGTAANMNANSGKNSNRTTQTIDGVTTKYCYDYADRLVSGTGNALGGITYDSHGNMTHIGTPSGSNSELYMFYDSSDRNSGMEQYDANGQGSAVYYDRDVAGRIIGRYGSSISNWSFASRGDLYYGYTGDSDGPSFTRDANWNIVEESLHLAGGVLMTIKPQETVAANKKQYSMQNMLGRT